MDPCLLFYVLIVSWLTTAVQSYISVVSINNHRRWGVMAKRKTLLPLSTINTPSAINGAYGASNVDDTYTMEQKKPVVASISFLVPSYESKTIVSKFGSASPYGNPPVIEAVQHLSDKLFVWSNGTVESNVICIDEYMNQNDPTFTLHLAEVDALIAIGIQSKADIEFVSSIFTTRFNRPKSIRERQCQFILDSAGTSNIVTDTIPTFTGIYDTSIPSIVTDILPWTKLATARRLHEQMTDLYCRWTSDDFCYATLIFINQFSGTEIDWVKHSIDATWEKGPLRNLQEFYNMVDKCGDCIVNCVNDESCKACITKLTEIDSRDQVANYQTIVSFESDLLKEFSQCILTRNNIFGCDAKIPTLPKVFPIKTFRGSTVTEAVARSLLVGHLDDSNAFSETLKHNVSWIVACGANAAYDQFPSQNQVFYPASRGRDMWYDPVFRVNTLDGRSVWCKRHYKVRPQKDPATFRFSVLDNGVTSDEFWTIIAVADNLSWIIFHYAGAAKSVGLQYLGGLLCTPDGEMPTNEDELNIIWNHFRSAGIQPWELYKVDNRLDTAAAILAGPPPLDYYRKRVVSTT